MSDVLQAITEGLVEYLMQTRPHSPDTSSHPTVQVLFRGRPVQLLRVKFGAHIVGPDGRKMLADVACIRLGDRVRKVLLEELTTSTGVRLSTVADTLQEPRIDPIPVQYRAFHMRFGPVGVIRKLGEEVEILVEQGDVMDIDAEDRTALDPWLIPSARRAFDAAQARTRWVHVSELLPIELYERLRMEAERSSDLYVIASAVGSDRPIGGMDGFWKVLRTYPPRVVTDRHGRPVVWLTPDGERVPLVEPPMALVMNEQGWLRVVPTWWLLDVRTGERMAANFMPPTFDPEDRYEPGIYPAKAHRVVRRSGEKADHRRRRSQAATPLPLRPIYPEAWYWEGGLIGKEEAGIATDRWSFAEPLSFGPGDVVGHMDVWFAPSVVANPIAWPNEPPTDRQLIESAGYMRFVLAVSKDRSRLVVREVMLVSPGRPIYPDDETGQLRSTVSLELARAAGVEFTEDHARFVLQQAELRLRYAYDRWQRDRYEAAQVDTRVHRGRTETPQKRPTRSSAKPRLQGSRTSGRPAPVQAEVVLVG